MTGDGEYRSKLLKLLADQAHAELEVSNTYSKWIHKAPGPEERMHLAKIAHTEQYIRLGLNYRGNKDRRRAFCRDCERQIRELGLQVPKLYKHTYPFFRLSTLPVSFTNAFNMSGGSRHGGQSRSGLDVHVPLANAKNVRGLAKIAQSHRAGLRDFEVTPMPSMEDPATLRPIRERELLGKTPKLPHLLEKDKAPPNRRRIPSREVQNLLCFLVVNKRSGGYPWGQLHPPTCGV